MTAWLSWRFRTVLPHCRVRRYLTWRSLGIGRRVAWSEARA